jgi:hypothetical protein
MVLLADEELLFFVVATRVTFICFKKKKKPMTKYIVMQVSFFRLHAARKHPKKFPFYERYKNSRIFLNEEAKCQP